MKVVAYTRVSTQQQTDTKIGLDSQREQIRKYCEFYGYELVQEFSDESKSGSSLKQRTGLQEALQYLREGKAEGLVVYSLDRLTRSLYDLKCILNQGFMDSKISLHSCKEKIDTQSKSGRMLLDLMGLFAEWEWNTIQERNEEVHKMKRLRGERVGRKSKLVEGEDIYHSNNPEVVRRIMLLHSQRNSCYRIAKVLTEEYNRPWHKGTVSRIIKREKTKFKKAA